MSEKLSGQQIGATNLKRFKKWIDERDQAGDWADYWDNRRNQVSRSEIAAECDFNRRAVTQNPGIEAELAVLDVRLREELGWQIAHLKTESDAAASDRAVAARLAKAKASSDNRVKVLEEKNAALRAEVSTLRERQKKWQHLDAHLAETGRMVRP
jgi:MoxR-like ATPase